VEHLSRDKASSAEKVEERSSTEELVVPALVAQAKTSSHALSNSKRDHREREVPPREGSRRTSKKNRRSLLVQ
jgi:hypothetical protein